MTHYQRPGLAVLATPGTPGAGRCVYQASNGDGYIIVGSKVYYVSPTWTLTSLGSIDGSTSTPCSMVDNGSQIIVVNGVPYAGNATGTIYFAGNPSNLDTVTLNAVVWTFVAGAPSGNQVQIAANTALTGSALITALQASVDPLITTGSYTGSGGPGTWTLTVTSKVTGARGTLYTTAASVATPSGAHLVLGGTPVAGHGYIIVMGSLSGSSVVAINDAAWTGADRVDYIDTFIVWNIPGTRNFGSTLSNQILPLDATYVAGKVGWPDPLQSIIVNHEQIMLPGLLKSELWYTNGGALFPFAQLPGVYIEHGITAKYSLASADINIYWLSRDLQGQGIVLRQRGNETTKRISNYALEYAIRQMYTAGTDITDAVGYTWQIDGHLFYVLSFPSGNQTWVWDESVADPELGWSQRGWTDSAGVFNRDRGLLGASLYGKNVVLDWENGTLYEQSMTTYTDTVSTVDYPITYLRTFPHLMLGTDPKTGQPILANGQMIRHDRFALNAECGNATTVAPQFSLRWSDDRGRTWGNPVLLSAGAQGEYGTRPDERVLGMAMDRVYEVSWTFPGQVALNGAWVEGQVANQ